MEPSHPAEPIDPRPHPTRIPLWVVLILTLLGGAAIVIFVAVSWLFNLPLSSSDADTRAMATLASGQTVMAMIQTYDLDYGTKPPSLDALVPKYTKRVPRDAWNRPLLYTLDPDGTLTLRSLGADGQPGGTGSNSDLWWQQSTGEATHGEGAPPTHTGAAPSRH